MFVVFRKVYFLRNDRFLKKTMTHVAMTLPALAEVLERQHTSKTADDITGWDRQDHVETPEPRQASLR